MLTYFQDGGFSMWLILLVSIASVAVAMASKGPRRARVFALGSYAALISGVFGMAMGMVAVSHNIARFADKGAAVAQGLGELSNNGTFAAALSLVLALAAVATSPRGETRAA